MYQNSYTIKYMEIMLTDAIFCSDVIASQLLTSFPVLLFICPILFSHFLISYLI